MVGKEIHDLAKSLWGINRSLSGEGVRQTLEVIKTVIPNLKICEAASGTAVFDWTIPQEWKVNAAYIIAPDGSKICDFSVNNLHLMGYSESFKGTLSLQELNDRLYSLEDQPEAIPYVTSYYSRNWGFCISHNQRSLLKEGDYRVFIDAEHFDGVLNYGELLIPGAEQKEVLLSTYICHPSMANNELSGPCVTTYLAKKISEIENLRYTYRIVFLPETIGSIIYLSKNLKHLQQNVIAGFNISCIGDERNYSYLPSRQGNSLSDRVAVAILSNLAPEFIKYTWLDRGSDERQYCAPGVDLPIASIMRTKYGEFPEYHTSLDNLEDVVTPVGLEGGYQAILKSIELLEKNNVYNSVNFCEPNLGKRGLYPTISTKAQNKKVRTLTNFLSYCDGTNDLIDIAIKIKVPVWELYEIVEQLLENRLIEQS